MLTFRSVTAAGDARVAAAEVIGVTGPEARVYVGWARGRIVVRDRARRPLLTVKVACPNDARELAHELYRGGRAPCLKIAY